MLRYIAGSNINHALTVGKKYINKNKKPIINYAVEGKNNYRKTYKEYNKIISLLPENYSIALKLSSFNFDSLSISDTINNANNKNIKVFIDAESDKNNEIYQDISTDLLLKHQNVYKTYQMYRKDSLNVLMSDIIKCNKTNIPFSGKLVRGAYWNTEKNDGHLFIKKEDTDESYNQAILNINKFEFNTQPNIVLATHNEKSIYIARLLNKDLFEFAHLQGMNECYYNNICNTSNVYVYIPYGPYNEMIPYLSRRLYENIDMLKYTIR